MKSKLILTTLLALSLFCNIYSSYNYQNAIEQLNTNVNKLKVDLKQKEIELTNALNMNVKINKEVKALKEELSK